MPFSFHVQSTDATTRARRGSFRTIHGRVETPVFMPVGTRATVTGMTPDDLHRLDPEIILGNTYHLMLRPGPEAMVHFGGLHRFMAWEKPILTDSGGFQIFSLPSDRTISEEGARFRSYVDSRYHTLSPERSIEVQTALGSDIMMVLDICLPSTAPAEEIRDAMQRTHRWALRSLAARTNPEQALFAIVQGGLSPALRSESARFLTQHAFDGFAIGGLAVGDTRSQRSDLVAHAAELLPGDKPRYLMGVGTPADIVEAIAQGVDMFDCVIPTSLAWQGTAFTSTGRVRLTRSEHRLSEEPLDAACGCPTCRRHTRGYLYHLMKCREPLGPRLLSQHNLQHYLDLIRGARAAIEAGTYGAWARETLERIDRHEHDPHARPPGARPAAAEPRYEIVETQGGPAVRDRVAGEIMHPVVGAAAESEQLYVSQSRLEERLRGAGDPLVVFDVGLGAASNALAAIRAARAVRAPARRLEIVSFERDTSALAFALGAAAADRLGLAAEDVAAARTLLAHGLHEEERVRWSLAEGDAIQSLATERRLADIVFWDPFSPKQDGEMWSAGAFAALRARCGSRATVFTYSTATAVRSALLLAGFFVGIGDASGPKAGTTAAAVDPADLVRPLDGRWLERLARSSAPFPEDAPADAIERVREHPQFARAATSRPLV